MTDSTDTGDLDSTLPGVESLHEQLLDISPVSIVIVNRERTIVLANARAQDDLGLSQNEVLGLSADDSDVQVLDDEEAPIDADQTVSARVLRTGEPIYGELTHLILPGGNELWLSVNGRPLTDESGAVIGAILAFENVTERKTYERDLELKNRRLEDLASVISHEFRNPLQIARGFTEMARTSGDSDHFEKVERSHQRMEILIDRLLNLSTASATPSSSVDLAVAAERAWGRIDTRDAALTVESGLHSLAADEGALVDLLTQLFENSLEHGSPSHPEVRAAEESSPVDGDGGGVTVQLGPLDDGFYVADDGVGIPPGQRDGLFEATPSAEGETGSFGLDIVRTIVDEHGWCIRAVESGSGGARFEVWDCSPTENSPSAP